MFQEVTPPAVLGLCPAQGWLLKAEVSGLGLHKLVGGSALPLVPCGPLGVSEILGCALGNLSLHHGGHAGLGPGPCLTAVGLERCWTRGPRLP